MANIWQGTIFTGGGSSGGGGETISNITASLDVGAIDAGDVVPAGSTLQAFATQLLADTFYPTFTNPSASISTSISSEVESGFTSDVVLTLNFNRGSINGDLVGGVWNSGAFQDYRAGEATEYIIEAENLGLVNTKTLTAYQVIDGANSWNGSVSHLEGTQPLDSDGVPYGSPYPAGSLSGSGTVYGRRKCFYGVSNSASSSADIRLLSNSFLNPSAGSSFTVNIPSGATNVVIAYPATIQDISTIKYVEGLNAEVKDAFIQSTLSVEGQNGYTAINYKVYVYTPVEPFGDPATYTVVI